jgi:hypothetical protein
MDIKESLSSTINRKSLALNQTLTPSSLGLIGTRDEARLVTKDLTPEKAWRDGTNLISALRADQPVIRAWLAASLFALVKALGCRNTFDNQEQVLDACDSLIDEFPALKMEEVALVFLWLRRGKLVKDLFGTFRERELLDAFRKYEGEYRARILEEQNRVEYTSTSGRRASADYDKDVFKPILLDKESLQAIGIWPEDSPSEAETTQEPD